MKYKPCIAYLIVIVAIANFSCISNSEVVSNDPHANKALDISFELPKSEIKYSGTYQQKGDGPLGPMDINGNATMTLKPSNKWPIYSSLTLHLTHAKIVDYKEEWQEAGTDDLPPPMTLPAFTFDKYGHSKSSYHIGEMPLSMVGDLWPLPPKPLKISHPYKEQITQKKYDFREHGEGTREIKFPGYETINKKEYLCINIHTTVDVEFEKDEPLFILTIDSKVLWDTTDNLPFKVTQKANWKGTFKVSDSEQKDFNHVMILNLKRTFTEQTNENQRHRKCH